MAVQFDANGDYLFRTGMVTASAWTMTCWARVDTDNNNYACIFGGSGGSAVEYIELGADGTSVDVGSFAGAAQGPSLTVGTWYFLAGTYTGGTATIYWAEAGQALSSATGPGVSLVSTWNVYAGAVIHDFSAINDSVFRGSLAHARLWTAQLNSTELAAEMVSTTAVRATNLWGVWPLAANANDTSGNARHLTENGTLAYVADPTLSPPAGATVIASARRRHLLRR